MVDCQFAQKAWLSFWSYVNDEYSSEVVALKILLRRVEGVNAPNRFAHKGEKIRVGKMLVLRQGPVGKVQQRNSPVQNG